MFAVTGTRLDRSFKLTHIYPVLTARYFAGLNYNLLPAGVSDFFVLGILCVLFVAYLLPSRRRRSRSRFKVTTLALYIN